MKRTLILISAIVLASCSSSDDVSSGDAYIKFYGGNASYELKDMILTNDQAGIVFFGNKTLTGDVSTFFTLIADMEGRELSRLEYRIFEDEGVVGFSEFNMEASRIAAIDNGYLVVGTRLYIDLNDPLGTPRPLAIWGELNASFELVGNWNVLGDSVNAFYGVDITQSSDGGVILSGYTDVNGTNDFFYSKFGGTEDEWSRIQTRPGSDDRLVRALPYEDGSIVLVGRTDTPSDDGEGGVNIERTVVSTNGTILNSQIYGLSDATNSNRDDFPTDMIAISGGFAVVGRSVGTSETKPFLLRVDLTGASSDDTLYNTEFLNRNAGATGLARTGVNDYFVIGTVEDFVTDEANGEQRGDEVLTMLTDQDGTIRGTWNTYGLINGNESGVRVLKASDGSMLVGSTYDFGSGLLQFALLKMNVEGELKK
jgi:hypothetical protein